MIAKKELNLDILRFKSWKLLLLFPMICSYYIVWYVYTYLFLSFVSMIDSDKEEALSIHKQSIHMLILAMMISMLSLNFLPRDSMLNISQVHLSQFIGWIYNSVVEDFSHTKLIEKF